MLIATDAEVDFHGPGDLDLFRFVPSHRLREHLAILRTGRRFRRHFHEPVAERFEVGLAFVAHLGFGLGAEFVNPFADFNIFQQSLAALSRSLFGVTGADVGLSERETARDPLAKSLLFRVQFHRVDGISQN